MKSYITGSRAYGTPRENSDIDLVVAVSSKDYNLLWSFAKENKLQFGNLNLVAFNIDIPEEKLRYERWTKVNEKLIAQKPVTKEKAIEEFRAADAEKAYKK